MTDLQRQRIRMGFSVLELAQEVGVTDTAIRDIETGKRKLPFRRVPAFCKKLDLDVDELTREVLNAGPIKLDIHDYPPEHQEAIASVLSKALVAAAAAVNDPDDDEDA